MSDIYSWAITNRITILATLGSLSLLIFIFKLIKRKKLKEEYSLLWIAFSIIFLILSIFKPLLEWFASLVGIYYAPAALLLTLVIANFFILIQFSIVISKLSENNKNLTQEIGLLKASIKNNREH